MNREKNYGNFQLNRKKLEELKKIFSKEGEYDSLLINIKHTVKEDRMKISKFEKFTSFDEMIDYININGIDKVNTIRIDVHVKNHIILYLEYDESNKNWLLSYNEKNSFTDSILFNLNILFRFRYLNLFLSHLGSFIGTLSILYILIRYGFKICNYYFDLIYSIIMIVLFALYVCNGRSAYKENRFVEKNKDSIILSILFYILGVVSPYIISLIQMFFK